MDKSNVSLSPKGRHPTEMEYLSGTDEFGTCQHAGCVDLRSEGRRVPSVIGKGSECHSKPAEYKLCRQGGLTASLGNSIP